MKLKYLLEKEFKQFFRNKFFPKLIFLFPILMILVFPWAANMEITDVKIAVIDNDCTPLSMRMLNKIEASSYFIVTEHCITYKQALKTVEDGDVDIILEIPANFEQNLTNEGFSKVMISANSVNGTRGGVGSSYLSATIANFAQELQTESGISTTFVNPQIIPMSQVRFNPQMDYKKFMIPAIMAMLLTLICGFLPALNIVGEKEAGTIEQINVTPVSKFTFIIAKLIPYWLIGLVVFSLCFLAAYLIYGFASVGSLFTVYAGALLFVFCISGFGLIISNYSDTMQQAMFVCFFIVLILVLISGLFTPVTAMPQWAQYIAAANPLKYFIHIMRSVYLKGSGIVDLLPQMGMIALFAVLLNTWAIISYRKRG